MSGGTGRAVGRLSFRRIIDTPFETCAAALENWQRTEQDGELRIGHSLLRGPIEHDRDSGTCRIEVRLARGPLRPRLRMRLNIDRWSWPPARTALELIPCDRVRPTAAYFRSGHLLLDSLTHSVPRHAPAQRLDHVPANQPTARQGLPRPGEQSIDTPNESGLTLHVHECHDDLRLPAEAIALIVQDTRQREGRAVRRTPDRAVTTTPPDGPQSRFDAMSDWTAA